jgi:ATP-dependent Clp endopeptidase proteolytic subunit ClpP|tara:strand:+ start:2249 stop:2845 length:597 start_codon:yes stop_codon:yes gene_type:complete
MKEYWGEKNPAPKKNVKPGEEKHISVYENKIYYYSGVNRETVVELNHKLSELEAKHLTVSNVLEIDPPPIRLFINSGGGSITAGIASMDTISRCNVPVYTFVDGFCASAATFLSVVGKKRFMSKNSYMLIHQLSSQLWGKYSEIEDEKKNLDLMMETIRTVYTEHTKVPTEELDEILKHDLLWDAKKCLEYGLVDEII